MEYYPLAHDPNALCFIDIISHHIGVIPLFYNIMIAFIAWCGELYNTTKYLYNAHFGTGFLNAVYSL